MSTMMEKGRNLGTSVWLILLLVSVAIFGLNTGYATYLGGKLAGAGSSAADLQVLSQRPRPGSMATSPASRAVTAASRACPARSPKWRRPGNRSARAPNS